jgi:hypothetical protein
MMVLTQRSVVKSNKISPYALQIWTPTWTTLFVEDPLVADFQCKWFLLPCQVRDVLLSAPYCKMQRGASSLVLGQFDHTFSDRTACTPSTLSHLSHLIHMSISRKQLKIYPQLILDSWYTQREMSQLFLASSQLNVIVIRRIPPVNHHKSQNW